mgnify:CR=1 FL=1
MSNPTPGHPVPDVGVYGSNQNLGGNVNNQKINIESKCSFKYDKNLIFDSHLEQTANEEDERYRYLLKNGIVRRVEDEDKIIFAELP